jgi:hypothetical protein
LPVPIAQIGSYAITTFAQQPIFAAANHQIEIFVKSRVDQEACVVRKAPTLRSNLLKVKSEGSLLTCDCCCLPSDNSAGLITLSLL